MRKTAVEIFRWTIGRAASEWRIDPKTLTSRIKAAGVVPGADGFFSTLDIHRSINGDIDAERLRKTREEADRLELENAKERGTLIEIESVYKHFEGVFIAFRARVLASNLEDFEKDEMLKDLLKLKARDIAIMTL